MVSTAAPRSGVCSSELDDGNSHRGELIASHVPCRKEMRHVKAAQKAALDNMSFAIATLLMRQP